MGASKAEAGTSATSARSCLNCGRVLQGAYCSECGQAASVGRLSLRQVIDDLFSEFSSWDSRLPRTLRRLTVDPGGLCRDYVAGQRVGYVAPLRYLLLALALSVLSNWWLDFDPATVMAAGPALSARQQAVRDSVATLVLEHLDWMVLLALPLVVLSLRLLYRHSGRNLAEIAAFLMYVQGHLLVLSLLLWPLKLSLPMAAIALRAMLQWWLLARAGKAFFRVGALAASWRGLLATVCAYLAMLLAAVAISLPTLLAS
ncbi:MAG: DUF3667 domain-containing protein [Xanthomonadales bacterium]|nr:DUF3667 domain-containing protein [Xanthomonadales bacterium]